jgi:cytoskeletal protein RodZ
MAEIGATLREARMRQRIDITDMEVRTKIRAKYLRALENEEWDLLPGPTYVRSFLRTYAEALGLDAKMIVEEYKLRHEPTEAGELHPIRRPTQRERATRRGGPRRRRRGLPRGALVGLVLAAIVLALFFVGRTGRRDDEPPASSVPTMPAEREDRRARSRASARAQATPARSRTVRLQLVPTGPVSSASSTRPARS